MRSPPRGMSRRGWTMPAKKPAPKTARKTAQKRKAPEKGKDTRFKPGNPGGPGKPRGLTKATFYQGLRDYLEVTGGDGKNRLNRFIESFFESALDGKGWQANMLAERLLEKDFLDKITTQLDAGRREDEDFMAYRCIKDTFGQQMAYAMSNSRLSLAMAGRRAGKTDGNFRAVAAQASRPGSIILILGLTFSTAEQLYWDKIVSLLDALGLQREIESRTEGHLKLENGSEVFFRGNSTRDEREKLRGFKWSLVIVDEAQSQKALPYLLDDILGPACVDLKGRIKLSGTGPRVRGTYWEQLWTAPGMDRYSWNLMANPFIPDGEAELARVRETKALTETSPLYVREYLGQIAYDDDALVFRLGEANYFDDAAFLAWLRIIPPTDLRLSGGLDIGFEDADGFAILCHAINRPERWLIHEYKARREGTQALADAVKAGIAKVKALPGLAAAPLVVYTDEGGGGKKTSFDLSDTYGLPCQPAYKQEKALGIEMMQDDVRTGKLKVRNGGSFADEALKTVFRRNERDELTREVDDDTYHPDLADAILYALRPIQLYGKPGEVDPMAAKAASNPILDDWLKKGGKE
jgi:hypothetical protein